MATNQQPWEVLTYTYHTCGVTAPWGGSLLEHHLNHSIIRIACNDVCPSRTRRQPYTTLISTYIPVVVIKLRIDAYRPMTSRQLHITHRNALSPLRLLALRNRMYYAPHSHQWPHQQHSRPLLHYSQLNSRAHVRRRQLHQRAPQPPLLPVTWSICEIN